MPGSHKPKILILDIETLPNLAYTWGKYEQNVLDFKQQSCIACFVAKWVGGGVVSVSLPECAGYKPGSYDDRHIALLLWEILDDADIVVSHNGNSFDLKVITGRFIVHGFNPPSPYKQVDTKLLAKRVARFNSNRLNDLSELLGNGEKIKTDFGLWQGCINGDPKAWKRMVQYNRRDVLLLEKLYLRLRPWDETHPNQAIYRMKRVCPKCGSSRLLSHGFRFADTRRYRRLQCLKCGAWSRETQMESKVTVR